MPSLNSAIFTQRRQQLLDCLPPQAVVILPSASLATRSRDTEYPFRQSSDFWYLTGFNEPDALLVLAKGWQAGEQILFNQPKDKLLETWTGVRLGQELAISELGFDLAYTNTQTDTYLPDLLAQASEVWLPLEDAQLYNQYLTWLANARAKHRRLASLPTKLYDLSYHLGEQRLIKQPEEIELMRTAAQISALAHVQAMQVCRVGKYEYQLEAELEYVFKQQGAKAPAYTSIVGSGANACILHYVENSDQLKDGDLVLIDAGAEYQGYAGDITRTFPVNGRFSPEQKLIYDLVLEANELAISLASPNATLEQLHQAVVRCITAGLIQLEILTGSVEVAIQQESYKQFFMHGTSHWLGLDVHDVGQYLINGQARPLQEGMVFTIEPGLYFAPDDLSVAAKWRGIGVRIEDNILITATGCEVLTSSVPKTVAAIENLMQAAKHAS